MDEAALDHRAGHHGLEPGAGRGRITYEHMRRSLCACVRKQNRGAIMCLLLVLQFATVQGMQHDGPPQQPTDLSEVLTALTRATQVGMSALQRLEQHASSSDDLNRRIEKCNKGDQGTGCLEPTSCGRTPM